MVKLTALLRWNDAHNLPKKYILRRMFKGVVYENNHGITPPVVYNYTKNWTYTVNAPWTTEAQNENNPAQQIGKKKIIVPPLTDWFWFRGDLVQILTGKDSGKIGEIVGVIKERNWVIVGGFNCKLESTVAGSASIVRQVEKPLIVSKEVKLIDPFDKKPCDAVWRYTDEGAKVRVSKRSGRIIPIFDKAYATNEYSKKSAYVSGPKDTKEDDIKSETFKAKLKTFEQDLMDEYGIKETRERAPTYTY